MTRSLPPSPKYKNRIRIYVGKAVVVDEVIPFTARRSAIRALSRELRRLWKRHAGSHVSAIRGSVAKKVKDEYQTFHWAYIDRESSQNGWKRMVILEGQPQ